MTDYGIPDNILFGNACITDIQCYNNFRWQKAKFGDHTYVQKMKGKRPVGATHAGKRPKTAPQSFQDRWKTEKVRKCFIGILKYTLLMKHKKCKQLQLYITSLSDIQNSTLKVI